MDWKAAEARFKEELKASEAAARASGRCAVSAEVAAELAACASGGEKATESLLRALKLGANPNLLVKSGGAMVSLLSWALDRVDARGVEALLEAGADMEAEPGGWSGALTGAIREDDVELVRALLKARGGWHDQAQGDAGHPGLGPLLLAVTLRSEKMVAELLAQGADANGEQEVDKSQPGMAGLDALSPLHIAARMDELGVCKILVGAGADLESLSKVAGVSGEKCLMTPAQWARERRKSTVADWLDAVALARGEREALSEQSEPREGARSQGGGQVAKYKRPL